MQPAAMLLLIALCAIGPLGAEAASIRGHSQNLVKTQGFESCGKLEEFDNAEPKNYDDAMKTKFNEETKKREPVTFKTGDEIDFKCKMGFTLDGSKDGKTEFKVKCAETGYFKPDGICMKASLCGTPPAIKAATATPKAIPGAVQYKCNPGYSLDGEKVVAGGMGKNTLFVLKCVEFSGEYEKFKGECKPYAFMPSKESTQIYTDVFEALFIATCKGKVSDAFGHGKSAPVDSACGKVKSPSASGPCSSLVSEIKSAFDAKKKEVKEFEKGKEWYEDKGKPSISADAMKFCTSLWALVKEPNGL
jgi:hypothetical protein